VDYYLRRTPSFHPVRRAFAPLAVALAVEDEQLRVFCVNDGAPAEVEVRFGLVALAGGFPVDERVRLRAAGNASSPVGSLGLGLWRELGERSHAAFAVLSLEGREVARDTLFLPLFREMEWPEARVAVRREGSKAVFSCDTFAWRVCLDLDGERRLPDNFFDLLPGLAYEVEWAVGLGEPRVLRVGNREVRRE
jgi:beta-mannosidase